MNIRKATEGDINALILMRWEFTLEHQPGVSDDFEFFATECRAFLERVYAMQRSYGTVLIM